MEQYRKDYYIDIFKVLLIFLNIVTFFNYVTNTQVIFNTILLAYILFSLFGFIIYKVFDIQKTIKNIYVFLLIVLPFIFNSFFFLNYFFSSNPQKENYHFYNTQTDIGPKWDWKSRGNSTTIDLENNAYSDFYFLRTFFDYEKMKWKTEIIYTFEDGLFGLRVLKDYKFSGSY
jgi:hypothetical protein